MAARSRSTRPSRPLRRAVATRTPRKTVAVWCEGSRTEPLYLSALKSEPEVRDVAAVDIRIQEPSEGAVPLTLVSRAVDQRKRALAEEGEIDEFWCIFDVEWPLNHPNLQQALDLAQGNGIRVAVSNPCFEVWLAFHFTPHAGFLSNHDAKALLRQYEDRPDKGLDSSLYMLHRSAARRTAAKLDAMHAKNGTIFPHNNPSSGMHSFLASVDSQDA